MMCEHVRGDSFGGSFRSTRKFVGESLASMAVAAGLAGLRTGNREGNIAVTPSMPNTIEMATCRTSIDGGAHDD